MKPVSQSYDAPFNWERITNKVFYICAIVFGLITIGIAFLNTHPGSPDSMRNLEIARNISSGDGFVTYIVQAHVNLFSLPHIETERTPFIPYVLALLFYIFGYSLFFPVFLNAIAVIGTAFLLRWSLKKKGDVMAANLVGILILISHQNYEIISIWNNGWIALISSAFIATYVLNDQEKLRPASLVIICAVLSAAGIFLKQTYFISVTLVSIWLIYSSRPKVSCQYKHKLAYMAVYLLITIVLVSPYLWRDIKHFNKPLYSTYSKHRLFVRFKLLNENVNYFAILGPGATYGDILQNIGVVRAISRELSIYKEAFYAIIKQNPFIWILFLMGSMVFWKGQNTKDLIVVLLLQAESLLVIMFAHIEDRYFWAVFPCMLFLLPAVFQGYKYYKKTIPKLLATRIDNLFILLIILAIVYSSYNFIFKFRSDFYRCQSTPPTWSSPDWVETIKKLSAESIITTKLPYEVNWYTKKKSIMLPKGRKKDLEEIFNTYRPSHFLQTDDDIPFNKNEIRCLDEGIGWKIYALSPTAIPKPIDPNKMWNNAKQ